MKCLIISLLLLVSCPVFCLAVEDKQQRDTYRDLETFANVLTLVQQYYVDEVDSKKVIEGAINGMLGSLDPHSAYMTPEDFKDLEEETSGSFTGIGIEITIREGMLTAVSPIEGTPAERQGIRSGDQIVKINGSATKSMTLMEAVKKLRGEKGTSVTITIQREDWKEGRDFTLVREEIPLHSVKFVELEPGFAYIRVSNFQATTSKDVRGALKELRKKHPVQGLVLDLRNNPGGLLDQAVNVADIFLDKGAIVSTKGRDNREQMVFEAHADGGSGRYPMVVLVNGGSASGAEIVAGALQDHKRAIVLGTTTFGKGSVQTILPLADGAGIRLTTAKYYTPSGDSIQATGIKPDMVVPFATGGDGKDETSQTMKAIREKDLPRHFKNEAGEEQSAGAGEDAAPESGDSEERLRTMEDIRQVGKRLEEDNQLRTALIVLKGLNLAASQQSQEPSPDAGGY